MRLLTLMNPDSKYQDFYQKRAKFAIIYDYL
jgi:hypothetical protein